MAGEFKGYGKRVGQKKGGIHKPDPDGGVYETDSDRYLIKRDIDNPQNDIAEYLASSIFATTAPGYGAEIELVQNTLNEPSVQKQDNQNAFLASRYFKDYKDFFKEVGYKDRPEKLEAVQGLLPMKGYVKKELSKKNENGSYKFNGYEQSLVTSLLLGDFSVHSGNMGVIGKRNDEQKKLVRIDFGAAFRDMQSDVNPYKSIKNRVGLEKNYFLRDHPKERIESKEFVAELRRVAAFDLTQVVEDKWNEVIKNFDAKAIQDFGQNLGMKEKTLTPDAIKVHFLKTLQERQNSLKDIATEISLNIAIKTNEPEKIKDAILEAVKENRAHCQKIVNNPTETQLQTNYSKHTLKLLENALNEEKEKIITIAPTSNKPEQKSIDTIILPKLETAPTLALSKLDLAKENTIISHVREQIIDRQIEIIKNAVGASNPNIDKYSPEEFTTYLKNPDNKKEINAALANPLMKKVFEQEMHQASVASYKNFHEKFKDDLKPVNWDGPAILGEKSQIVKNSSGEEICTLTEKTALKSEKFALSDGEEKNISSYRVIDFPLSIKEDAGPFHLSMALKDSEGKNMKADDAVYFTVHYDKAGKLSELTSPKAIRFKGNDPNSPGYIEHDGEIFTLPVTQGIYQSMMKEVAKNHGTALDLSQQIEVKKPEHKDVQKEKVNIVDTLSKEDKQRLEQIKEKMHSSSSFQEVSSNKTTPKLNQSKGQERGVGDA